MSDFANIIIPTIKIDNLLLLCVKKCLEQNHDNFMVSIITEDENNICKINDLKNIKKINIQIILVKNINISKKRNLAAYKFKSDFIAFIDSDAYPEKNWLKNSLNCFEDNIIAVTGPTGLPFPNEKYFNKIVNIAKRSYFCTGKWSIRKYSDKKFFISQTESCNLLINTNIFLELKGMNEDLYISEDTDLCNKINAKYGENRILYSGKNIIYHKDRNIINFLKQRFVFGMFISKDLSLFHKVDKFYLFMPLLTTILSLFGLFIIITSKKFFIVFFLLFLLLYILIFKDLSKFKLKFVDKNIGILFIILANFAYAFGNIFSFLKLNNLLARKIYRNSK